MKLKRAAAAALLVSFSCCAHAGTTGNDLYRRLGSDNPHEKAIGYSYLEGVLDSEDWYLMAEVFASADPKSRFIVPHICYGEADVTFGQLKDVVVKCLREHPENRHQNANVLIRFALLESFACANNPVRK
jgi:hypothetical protein